MSSVVSVLLDSIVSAYMFPFFFFNDTATTEIYTLSLHDALPISRHLPFAHEASIGVEKQLPGSIAVSADYIHLSHRSEEHTSELQSQSNLVCRLLLEKKNLLPQRATTRFTSKRLFVNPGAATRMC